MPDVAKDMWNDLYNQRGGDINTTRGMTSSFAGINNASDVRSKYGLGQDSSAIYQPLYQRLARNRQDALARGSARSGTSGTAEGSIFSPVESSYASGLQGLESSQGQTDSQMQQFVAQMLQGAMGSQDQFGLNKENLLSGLMSGQMGSLQNERQMAFQEKKPTGFEDIMQLLGAGAPVAAAALSPARG